MYVKFIVVREISTNLLDMKVEIHLNLIIKASQLKYYVNL